MKENYFEKRDKSSFKSGTTIIGILGKDFVLLASDRQGTMGSMASDFNAQKLNKLNDRIALGLAGTLGDAQKLIRIMKGEMKVYELERDKQISVKATATLLSNIMNANRMYPYFAGFIIAGYKNKPQIYSIDVVGGFGEYVDFTSIGSGSPYAMGVLEKGYKKNLTKKEAIELAIDSIKASRKRDVYTGGNINIFVITKDGIEELNK